MITIGVSTYRGGDRLARMLASTRASWRGPILVADDGTRAQSHEEAAHIADSCRIYAADLLVSHKNAGYFVNANRILRACKSPIILLMDDDTIYPSGLAERVVSLFERAPNVGVLSWVSRNVSNDVADSYRNGYAPDDVGHDAPPEPDTELAGSCAAYRVDTFRNVGFFDEDYRCYYGDSDAAVQLTMKGHPCFRIRWPEFPHVEHSTTTAFEELRWREGEARDRAVFLQKWGATPREIRDKTMKTLDCRNELDQLRGSS